MQTDDPAVSVTIDIAAGPERVWRVLTAFAGYPGWHPTLSATATPAELVPGAEIGLRLAGGAAGDQEFTAVVLAVEPARRLAWRAGAPGVFEGEHTFELAPLPGGGTRYTDTERWTGDLAATVVAEHRDELRAEYTRTVTALKEAAERPVIELGAVTVDCRDVGLVAGFWSALLGAPLREPLPGWRRLGPLTPGGPDLTFQPVPEDKVGKARLHLDLRTDDIDAATARVAALGGRDLDERHDYPEGTVRVVADPEGHEFCLVQYYGSAAG